MKTFDIVFDTMNGTLWKRVVAEDFWSAWALIREPYAEDPYLQLMVEPEEAEADVSPDPEDWEGQAWHDDCDSWESEYAEGSDADRAQAELDWYEFCEMHDLPWA